VHFALAPQFQQAHSRPNQESSRNDYRDLGELIVKSTARILRVHSLLQPSLVAAVLGLTSTLQAHENPVGCNDPSQGGTGGGGSQSIVPSLGLVHHGDIINYFPSLAILATSCQASNVNAFLTLPNGGVIQYLTNAKLNPGDFVSCPANPICRPGPYSYIVNHADETGILMGPIACPLTKDPNGLPRVVLLVNNQALGNSHTGPGSYDATFSFCGNNQSVVLHPNIACTNFCTNGVGQNGVITFGGAVINTGDTPLSSIRVSNLVNGVMTLVTNLGPVFQLGTNQSVAFSGSYTCNPCSPTTDTIFVRGQDAIGGVTNSTCTATCFTPFQPVLNIERASPNGVRLLWATNNPGLGLQFNTNLGTTNWQSVSNAPAILETNYVVTNAIDGSRKLYRLSKP
jgi:hypothetical protein